MPAPGGVIAIAPGGHLGAATRDGVIEVKTGPDYIVIWAAPTTVLLHEDVAYPVDEWHVTIHRDLSVHARSADRRKIISLQDAAEVRDRARLLLTVTTAREQSRSVTGPQQKSWGGAVIATPLTDDAYDPRDTSLALDLWAVPPGLANARLPPSVAGARLAHDRSGPLRFPTDAAHAFRNDQPPDCGFIYIFSWVTSTETRRTLRSPGTEMGTTFL